MERHTLIVVLVASLFMGMQVHAQDADCTVAQLDLAFMRPNRGRGSPLEMQFDVRAGLDQLVRLPAGTPQKPSPGETVSLALSEMETNWKVTVTDGSGNKSTCTLKASYLWSTYYSSVEANRGFTNSTTLDGNATLALLGLSDARPVEAITTLRLAVTRDRTATLTAGQSTLADSMGAAGQLRRRFASCDSADRYDYRTGHPLVFSSPLEESVIGSNVKGSYATVMVEVPGGVAPNDCFIVGYVFADSRQALIRVDGTEYRVPVASFASSKNVPTPYLKSPFSQLAPEPRVTMPLGMATLTATPIGFFVAVIGSAQRGEFGGTCPSLDALTREVEAGQFQVRAFPEPDAAGNAEVSLTTCIYRQIGADWGVVSPSDARYLGLLQPIKFEACVDGGSCSELAVGTGTAVKARVKHGQSIQLVATVRDGSDRTLQLPEPRVVVAREQVSIVPRLTSIPAGAAFSVEEGELNSLVLDPYFCRGWPAGVEASSQALPSQWLSAEFVVDGKVLPVSVERWNVTKNAVTGAPERFCAINPVINSSVKETIIAALRSPERQVFSTIRQRTEDGSVSMAATRRLYLASHEKFVRIALFTGVNGDGKPISSYIYGLPVTRYSKSLCIQPQNAMAERVGLDLNRVSLVDSLGQVSVRFRSLAQGTHEFSKGNDGWYCSNIGGEGVLNAQSIAAIVEPVTGSADSTLTVALDGKTKTCITSASDEGPRNCSATLSAETSDFIVGGDALGYSQVAAGSWQVRQWRITTEGPGQLASRELASQFRISGNIPGLYAFAMVPGVIGFSAEAGLAASIPLSDNSTGARGLGLAVSPYSATCLNVALLKNAFGVVPRACAAVALDAVSVKAATDSTPAALAFGFPSWSITLGLGGK